MASTFLLISTFLLLLATLLSTRSLLLKTVEYITDERRWSKFKLKQAKYYKRLAEMFKQRVSPLQIQNWWNRQAWDKYKACQENIIRHTGGGDGDDDWEDTDTDTDGEATLRKRLGCRLKDEVSGGFSRQRAT
ncbi:hypothetical protein K466DRAFT_73554 [Polyporus arcularius HHB13444]|uniref:Uncharacterized protein n=1 Tax=Polyporus arcularius HHB13444 TaxID=1314778 RepID=A0A5C3NMU0_9APHY|nr:hypothetical protein K466DRAFT_73554 [Polyporus arcularius HHB13444]